MTSPRQRTCRRTCGAALLLAALAAWPAGAAAAPDPAEWALPEASFAMVFRGADTLAARLDALEARFGGAPVIADAFATLRGWEAGGVRPWSRDWGPGLAPGAGLAVFVGADQRVRLVVGATDGAKARRSLAAFARRLDVQFEATDDGFAGPVPLRCADRAGLMVCDSVEVPTAAPGRPADLGDAWLSVRLAGPMLVTLPSPWGLMTERLRIDVRAEPDRLAVEAEVSIRPDAVAAFAVFRDIVRPTDGLSAVGSVHPRTPYLYKSSLDGPKLMAMLAEHAGDPAVAKLMGDLGRAWSGDVALSFVGGPTRPVLTLGLREGIAARDLLGPLAEWARLSGDQIAIDEGVIALVVPDEEPGAPTVARVKLAWRTVGRQLLIGVEPADLARTADERAPPPGLPPSLAARGSHGLYVAHLPTGALGVLPAVFEWQDLGLRRWTAAWTWFQLEARLIDSAALVLQPQEAGLRIEMQWSRL